MKACTGQPTPTSGRNTPLKTDLEKLRKDVLVQNEKNRIAEMPHAAASSESSSIKNPYANRSSVYASDAHTASVIDINQ